MHTRREVGLDSLLDELDMTVDVLDGIDDLNFNTTVLTAESGKAAVTAQGNPERTLTSYLSHLSCLLEEEISSALSSAFLRHTTTDAVIAIPAVCSRSMVGLFASTDILLGLVISCNELHVPSSNRSCLQLH
jgi:hypothetical protein